MAGTETVTLSIDYWPPWTNESQRIVVVGPPSELLDDALRRALPLENDSPSYKISAPDYPHPGATYWLGLIDDHVTLGDLVAFADGAVLAVDHDGVGGQFFPMLWDVIGGISTLAWLLEATLGSIDAAVDKVRDRHTRVAAKEWLDAGTDSDIPMALRQYVNREARWRRDEFDRTFGLDLVSGPTLLRRMNYEKTSSKPEVWTEVGWEAAFGEPPELH